MELVRTMLSDEPGDCGVDGYHTLVSLDVRFPSAQQQGTRPNWELQRKVSVFCRFVSRRLFFYECDWEVDPPWWPLVGLDPRMCVCPVRHECDKIVKIRTVTFGSGFGFGFGRGVLL